MRRVREEIAVNMIRRTDSPPEASTADAVTDDFAKVWGETFAEEMSSHDPDRLVKLVTEDVRWMEPFAHPGGVLTGRDHVRRWLVFLSQVLPDMRLHVEGTPVVSEDGRSVLLLWRVSGRMADRFTVAGWEPPGQVVEVVGLDAHTFRNGLLSHASSIANGNVLPRPPTRWFSPDPRD